MVYDTGALWRVYFHWWRVTMACVVLATVTMLMGHGNISIAFVVLAVVSNIVTGRAYRRFERACR